MRKSLYFIITFLLVLSFHAIIVPPSDAMIRIMPLGDSITWGTGSSDQTGYRRSLFLSLTGAGYPVDFVGSRSNGIPNDFDKFHEGHGGFRDDQVAADGL